jgi:hypothetical protein
MPACSHSVLYPSSNAYCANVSLSNCPSFKQYGRRLDLQFQPYHTYRKYKETSYMFCSSSLISGNLSCLFPFDIRKELKEYEISSLSCFFSCYVLDSFIHQQRVFVMLFVCLFLFPLRGGVWVIYIRLFQIF